MRIGSYACDSELHTEILKSLINNKFNVLRQKDRISFSLIVAETLFTVTLSVPAMPIT